VKSFAGKLLIACLALLAAESCLAQTPADFCVYRRGTTQTGFEFTVARNDQAPSAEWLPPVACRLTFAAASALRDSLKAAQTKGDFCVYRRGTTQTGFDFTVAQNGRAPGAEWLPPLACNLTFAAASSMRDSLKASQTRGNFCVYRRGTTLTGFEFTVAQNNQAPGAEWLPPLACNLTFPAASSMRDGLIAAQTTGDFCVFRRGTTLTGFEFTVALCSQPPSAEWLPPV